MSDLVLHTSLSQEEIENNFKDIDFFTELMNGLQEALEYKRGNSAGVALIRERTLPSVDVKELRGSLMMTQKVFSDMLGVSCRTVEAWESGKSTPTPTAKKLMRLIEEDHSLVQKLQS